MGLPKLKGGDAEYPLQPQRQDRAGIYTRSLEHWLEPQVLRQRGRIAIDARNVKKDLPAADAGQQSRQDHLGGDAVALARDLGLTPVFETARMYTGANPDLDYAGLYGIGSLELG